MQFGARSLSVCQSVSLSSWLVGWVLLECPSASPNYRFTAPSPPSSSLFSHVRFAMRAPFSGRRRRFLAVNNRVPLCHALLLTRVLLFPLIDHAAVTVAEFMFWSSFVLQSRPFCSRESPRACVINAFPLLPSIMSSVLHYVPHALYHHPHTIGRCRRREAHRKISLK